MNFIQYYKQVKDLDLTNNLDLLASADLIGCQELHFAIDSASGLKAIVAIYSTTLGPALGGCRAIAYPNTNAAVLDAMLLARSMAFKSALADLPLGGGKAVLIMPKDQKIWNAPTRSKLFRSFGKFLNTLQGRYITAVDSGTTVADMDLIAETTKFVTSTSKFNYTIADPSVATARGVFQGILAAVTFKFGQSSLNGIRVIVQGVGNVGYHLVKLLVHANAKVIICDLDPKIVAACLAKFPAITVYDPAQIYQAAAEVFAPCALGGVINLANVEKLAVNIIAGAANNPLAIDLHPQALAQLGILYIPDFVINAGGVIYVAGPILGQSETANLVQIDKIKDTVFQLLLQASVAGLTPYELAYKLAAQKLQIKNPEIL